MSDAAAFLSAGLHGGRSCPFLLVRPSSLHRNSACNSRLWSGPDPRRKHWSCAVALSFVPPTTTDPTTSKSPPICSATAIPSASGANASWPKDSSACKMPHAPDDPGAFPPDELVAVVNLATSKTQEHDQPATRWSLDDLAAAIINDAHHQAMSRAT